MKINKKQKFTYIDLFAGCGGMSLGLDAAGLNRSFANEFVSRLQILLKIGALCYYILLFFISGSKDVSKWITI
ncbi:MAG: DNA cytosine methyltransferase [Desulfobacteraceae bacterium]|nr:DNA cytosine methyltransferase [Desulfobacteraceae bacterium]